MAEQSYSYQRSLPALAVATFTGTTAVRTAPMFNSFRATQLKCVITTAVTVTACVVTVNREIKYGTTSSQIAIGTVSIPVGAAIGNIYVCDLTSIADTDLFAGEGISFTPDGASTAGAGWFGVLGFEYDEGPVPQPSSRLFTTVTSKPRSATGSIINLAFTAT